jgi:hypothetical protein
MMGFVVFHSVGEAIRQGFQIYDKTAEGYIARIMTMRGWAMAQIDLTTWPPLPLAAAAAGRSRHGALNRPNGGVGPQKRPPGRRDPKTRLDWLTQKGKTLTHAAPGRPEGRRSVSRACLALTFENSTSQV